MKQFLLGLWFSLPVQLFLLHFRRYQLLLVFWYILFATVAGHFMHSFGAESLFLAPEYSDNVNVSSTAIVGFALGIFIMSWNITTFIIHSRNLKFLVTTAQPFLKYCINNAIIPLVFLVFYFVKAVHYMRYQELYTGTEVLFLVSGFAGGFILSVFIAFVYFFGADKTIYRSMASVIDTANMQYALAPKNTPVPKERHEIRVWWFLSAKLSLRKPRDVRHYSQEFLDAVFKRHHMSAVIAISFAFISLVLLGYISDAKLFQLPAAASITVFFAILIAAAGAFTIFLHSWSIPVLVFIYLGLNWMYQHDIIDPRNKAYGLNYQNKNEQPVYDRTAVVNLARDSNRLVDEAQFISLLNRWKARQPEEKPVFYMINTSGGGMRSASFTMNALQRLDSLFEGSLMRRVFLINGASGGMLGAAYFRELYDQKQKGAVINLQSPQYVEDISKDLLNPMFSSFVTRDILGPVQQFQSGGYSYKKDRGYAFEEKLNQNTHGLLDKRLKDYAASEASATIPLMLFNSVINRDGRKMIISTQPLRFLMRSPRDSNGLNRVDPDAVDFHTFFAKQNPMNISILSALRMNATFPYILPNVWLPSAPVIDVMDAGLRDNFGQETSLRLVQVFKKWLQENTSKVVLLQLRDRGLSDWDKPRSGNSLISVLTKPFLLLQNNWYKLQDYYQHDQLEYLSASYGPSFQRLCFQYLPSRQDAHASLSFHLTEKEKKDIVLSLDHPVNQQEFARLRQLMKNQ